MPAKLGLKVINTGNTTSFRRPSYSETIRDVTFASEIKNLKEFLKTTLVVTAK